MKETRYYVNYKTRYRQTLSGNDTSEDHLDNIKKALKDGFVEVTAEEQDDFGEKTYKMVDAGWNKSTRTLPKYLHLID